MQPKICPVDVIAMYSTDGNIQPLRLRIENENRQRFRVDIDEILKTTEITYVGAEARVFLCRATVEGRRWLFELKYRIRSHSWYLLN